MTTHYHAGWNMVGYLPEMDASYPFESWADAKQSMIDDLDRAGDFAFDAGDDKGKDEADELSALMEDLNLDNGPGWDGYVGYMHYWIVACVESECETEEEYAS
jgi:hypothetical protein